VNRPKNDSKEDHPVWIGNIVEYVRQENGLFKIKLEAFDKLTTDEDINL
jgi:hypothetical protein